MEEGGILALLGNVRPPIRIWALELEIPGRHRHNTEHRQRDAKHVASLRKRGIDCVSSWVAMWQSALLSLAGVIES